MPLSMQRFFGKVVRVDLQLMGNLTECAKYYRLEQYDAAGHLVVNSTVDDPEDASPLSVPLSSSSSVDCGGFVGQPASNPSASAQPVTREISTPTPEGP